MSFCFRPTQREKITTVVCGLFSPFVGFVQKIIFFHFFNDFFHVNSVSCLIFTTCLFLSIVLCLDPKKPGKHITEESGGELNEFFFYKTHINSKLVINFCIFSYLINLEYNIESNGSTATTDNNNNNLIDIRVKRCTY